MGTVAKICSITDTLSKLQKDAKEINGVLQRKPGHNQLVIHDHLIKGYTRISVPMFPGNGGAAA